MHPLRSLVLTLAVAALTVLPSGCSSDEAAATEQQAPTTQSGPIAPEDFVADLLAAIDEHHTVHMSVEAPLLGSGEVDVEYGRPGGNKTQVRAELLEGPSNFVIAGSSVYIEQPDGGQYLVVDEDDASYGPTLDTFGGIGPHEAVVGLGEGIESVTRAGTMVIDSKPMSRYRVIANPSKASGAFFAMAGTSGIAESVTFDFYVDPRGLLRQVEAEVNGDLVVIKLSRWGKPVTIHVPSGEELITP